MREGTGEVDEAGMTTRVLVVDDDEAVRVLIRRFLENESSFEVVGEAGDPDEALVVAGRVKPDLVTMDYRMPGGTGDECIREMKSRWPDLHILALTSAAPEAIKKMIDAGAYAAIDKAHMELVLPAMYQIADRRDSDWRSESGVVVGSSSNLATHYEQLRAIIASMEAETAKQLAEQRSKLAERLDLLVVLKAILIATKNPNYSQTQALEAITELVCAVLETDEQDAA